jgi:molybdenum cofactor biosynthesis protein B
MKLRVATVTVSDTRTPEDDASGAALRQELSAFELLAHRIVPDEPEGLRAVVRELTGGVEAIVFTGGTGIAPRDQSPEALVPLFDKELQGFGEAFRRLSWDEVGPMSILSRATAGTVGDMLVFVLPGSVKAARLGARSLVAPVLAHGVALLRGQKHAHGGAA